MISRTLGIPASVATTTLSRCFIKVVLTLTEHIKRSWGRSWSEDMVNQTATCRGRLLCRGTAGQQIVRWGGGVTTCIKAHVSLEEVPHFLVESGPSGFPRTPARRTQRRPEMSAPAPSNCRGVITRRCCMSPWLHSFRPQMAVAGRTGEERREAVAVAFALSCRVAVTVAGQRIAAKARLASPLFFWHGRRPPAPPPASFAAAPRCSRRRTHRLQL